jgi:hypothetical protein
MIQSCSLDAEGMSAQRERYRRAGEGARLLDRGPRRLAVGLRDDVELDQVEELIAVERDCCPFFEIDWDPGRGQLSFAVTRLEHEPALEAIAYGLGLTPGRA